MRHIHTSDLMGFAILEPTYTRESEPELFDFMDLTDIPGIAEAVSVDEIKVVLRSASASGLAFLDAPANGSIAGTVHEDNDADGAPDSPDVVLAGATVYLDSDNDGTFDVGEPSTTSDALGAYSFTGLYAGTYRVRSVALDSYVLSGTQPVTVTLAWTSGGESWQVTGKDLYQQGATLTVAGSVIDDVDADGTADIGEAGIAGVTVTLYRDKNGNGTYDAVTDTSVRVATTSPAAETLGQFSMTMLPPGTYFLIETDPSGYVSTTSNTRTLVLTTESSTGNAFLDATAYTISGTVFSDRDGNLTQGGSEPGLSGVLVTGVKSAAVAVTATATTGASGTYTLTGLTVGEYTVTYAMPTGFAATSPASGSATVTIKIGRAHV